MKYIYMVFIIIFVGSAPMTVEGNCFDLIEESRKDLNQKHNSVDNINILISDPPCKDGNA